MKSQGLLGGSRRVRLREEGVVPEADRVCVCVFKRERFEDATPLLFLRTQGEGVTSQGVQATSGSWKR